MKTMSEKRIAAIKSGAVRLGHGSTIKVDAAAVRARRDANSKAVADALFGREKAPENAQDERRRAKAKAWKMFSVFIRLRDADSYGRVQCITCQRSDHWRTFDAGHYITRAKESTLFEERNVHAQCKGCNRFQGGKFFEHEQAIARKYGAAELQKLKDKAGFICKRTTQDYTFLANTYAIRIENIKKNEPGKFSKPL